jgi:cleavage and polyadenylation specificity factor subunit 3
MKHPNTILFSVLGGGGEVGANCFQLSLNGHQILLDCGTHPKKEGYAALPAFSLLQRSPDALIVTHGHVDHCGSTPYLARQFPGVKSYATLPTVRIMDRMLHNSVAVMETIAKERGVAEYPLYEHADVSTAMSSMQGVDFDSPFDLHLDGLPVEAQFLNAGHVLGSASVLLRTPGHSLFYTGDICEIDQELMGGHRLFDQNETVDTLVIESTHGATEESSVLPYAEEALRLGEAMAQVLKGGGSVLVPCFALGRMQEVLNVLARLQEERVIPPVPIYASGLGRAIYELYDRFSHYLAPGANLRSLEQFGRIGNVFDSNLVETLIGHPCIMVATSGMMLENTPSALIAQQMVRGSQHGIFFVGYLDHETLGYKLLHAKPGDRLRFQLGFPETEIKLETIKRFHFSAHAPRAALQKIIDRFKPKNIVYVHGDPDALDWMLLNTCNGSRSFVPAIGQTIALEA